MDQKRDIEGRMERSIKLLKKNIRYLRKKENRLTLDEMASRVGISRDSLFKIESMSERYPNLKTVLKIAFYCDVSVGDLMERDLERENERRELTAM